MSVREAKYKLADSGVNDLETLNPEVLRYWSSENVIKPNTVMPGSNIRILAECKICGHKWNPKLAQLVDKTRCPSCEDICLAQGLNDVATKYPHLAKFITDTSPISAREITIKTRKKVEVRCQRCPRTEMRFLKEYIGYCYRCIQRFVSKEQSVAVLRPEILECVSPNEDIDLYAVPEFSTFEILFICAVGHEYPQKISSWSIGSGCIVCQNRVVIQGVNDCATTHPAIAKMFSPNSPIQPTDVVAGSGLYGLFRCEKDHEWRTSVVTLKKGSGCNSCARAASRSKLEREIFDFVKTLDPAAISSNRTIIKPFEIDITLISKKIGIEVNGDYWHSDQILIERRGVSAFEWHKNKKSLAKSADFSLYFVWERDVKTRYDDVKLAITNLILHNEDSDILNALD